MRKIKTAALKPKVIIRVPGSKSYTHRALVAAALAEGRCVIEAPLFCDDTLYTLKGLEKFGPECKRQPDRIEIRGRGGRLDKVKEEIYLGNSGTSMRLLAAVAALAPGNCVLAGNQRMHRRPLAPLLEALEQLGAGISCRELPGCPPVAIAGPLTRGGRLRLDCSVSSQFLSALLMIAPCLEGETFIEVVRGPVSRPYIDLTVQLMERFGIRVRRHNYTWFKVKGRQAYRPGTYRVPPDMSQAGYFWAAAAITGTCVTVAGSNLPSYQGDVGLAHILEKMGCHKQVGPSGISITGGKLNAIQADMGDMPDVVPTLAVVAAFARGTTRLLNVGHLRAKESDRLAAVAEGLRRMGIVARSNGNCLEIEGGKPIAAQIDTYDDHRLAMSFAVAGLAVPGVKIKGDGCVTKSFPDFWNVFQELYR